MATYTKRGSTWKVQVRRYGISKSNTFPTKIACQKWANEIESLIDSGKYQRVPDIPVSDLLLRYAIEASPTKSGSKWEINRLKLMCQDPLAMVHLPVLDLSDIEQWRDRRLMSVSSASVNREWNLLSSVFKIAVQEWSMLEHNPMKEVTRPPASKVRDRQPSDQELDRLRFIVGEKGDTIDSKVFLAFLFAIETGMRMGEICRLQSVQGQVAQVIDPKNGDSREVPLSPEAMRIWKKAGPFGLTEPEVYYRFRKATGSAGIKDLTFDDSRNAAFPKLAKALNIVELSRATGHRNLKDLMVYFNTSAEEIAAKLN